MSARRRLQLTLPTHYRPPDRYEAVFRKRAQLAGNPGLPNLLRCLPGQSESVRQLCRPLVSVICLISVKETFTILLPKGSIGRRFARYALHERTIGVRAGGHGTIP